MRYKLFVPWGTRLGAFLTALCLFSCGSADDGNRSDKWDGFCHGGPLFGATGSNLVENETGIQAFTLDGGRAYWIAWEMDANGPSATVMRQCNVTDCENTLRSDTIGPNGWYTGYSPTPLVATSERLFWCDSRFLYCNKGNCSKPQVINLGGAVVNQFVLDGSHLVIATREGTLLTCSEADCDGSVERVPVAAPTGEVGFTGTSNIAADAEYYYLLSEKRILRLRKDGSVPFEVIARDVGTVSQLIVHGDALYWLESFPAKLRSCPKTGCAGTPTSVLDALHAPFAAIVEDDATYISEPAEMTPGDANGYAQPSPGSDRILRCNAAGCSALQRSSNAPHYGVVGPINVDSSNIYGIGEWSARDLYSGSNGDCSAIYIIAKNAEAVQ